jgi:hypothetical protein
MRCMHTTTAWLAHDTPRDDIWGRLEEEVRGQDQRFKCLVKYSREGPATNAPLMIVYNMVYEVYD